MCLMSKVYVPPTTMLATAASGVPSGISVSCTPRSERVRRKMPRATDDSGESHCLRTSVLPAWGPVRTWNVQVNLNLPDLPLLTASALMMRAV